MPETSKYNPNYHDDWAWSLAKNGATNEEIAFAMGINRRTITRWSYTKGPDGKKVRTSFGEALHTGKQIADAHVERSLYERCLGYTVKEVKRKLEHDEDGNERVICSEEIEKTVPPDTMAIIYWLNNRSRETGEWSQKQEIALSKSNDKDDVLIYLPSREEEKELMKDELTKALKSTEKIIKDR